MWILSLLFSLTGSAANLFFSLRYPSVAITPIIALVLVHPLGKFWDAVLKRTGDPLEVFENGSFHHRELLSGEIDAPEIHWLSRMRLWLAQGRWNEKEHACVYISSNVSFGFAFATDVHPLSAYPSLESYTNYIDRSLWNNINSTNKKFPSCTNCYSSFPPKSLGTPSLVLPDASLCGLLL